jgi:hypothetical protein
MDVLRNAVCCVRLDKSLCNCLFPTVELCNVGICAGTLLVPSAVDEDDYLFICFIPVCLGGPTYGRQVDPDRIDSKPQ